MKVAVVGATGLVGRNMVKILQERSFPVSELVPVASEKSVGKIINYNGRGYSVVSLEEGFLPNRILPFSRQEAMYLRSGRPNLQRQVAVL